MMQNDPFRDAEASRAPYRRQRQMDVRRQRIRKLVKRQRRPVQDVARALGPEPPGDEVFVLTRGEVDEPIESAMQTDGASAAHVVDEELRGVAGLGGLLGREEA